MSSETSARTWFDQRDPCPRCGHYNFDNAACAQAPGGPVVHCRCYHDAHFSGALDAAGAVDVEG